MRVEINLKNLASKILQALNVDYGDAIIFSITKSGDVIIQKDKGGSLDG